MCFAQTCERKLDLKRDGLFVFLEKQQQTKIDMLHYHASLLGCFTGPIVVVAVAI